MPWYSAFEVTHITRAEEDTLMTSGKKTSPWLIIGVGCFGLALIGALLAGFFVYKTGKSIQEMASNPEETALKIFAVDQLPPGYHANVAVKLPMGLMSTVIISNQERTENEENVGDDGFMYFELITFDQADKQEVQDYLSGKTNDTRALSRNNIDLGVRERDPIDRGTFPLASGTAYYLSMRGEFQNQHADSEGLISIIMIDCPEDKRFRLGMRFGPDPAPGVPDEDVDLTGTVSDPERLEAFLGGFTFCGK